MSLTTMTTNTSANRRAPAVATRLPARIAAPDPIIAAVSAALRLEQAVNAASRKCGQAQDAASAVGLPYCEPVKSIRGKDAKPSAPELGLLLLKTMLSIISERPADQETIEQKRKFRKAIRKASLRAKKAKAARYKRAAREYQRQEKRWKRADARFGISEAYAAYEQAEKDFEKAARAIARRKIRSPEGALAVVSLATILVDEGDETIGATLLRNVTAFGNQHMALVATPTCSRPN